MSRNENEMDCTVLKITDYPKKSPKYIREKVQMSPEEWKDSPMGKDFEEFETYEEFLKVMDMGCLKFEWIESPTLQ